MAFRNISKHIVIVAAILCLLSSIPPAYADLSDGLVAYYPFNGNVDEASEILL